MALTTSAWWNAALEAGLVLVDAVGDIGDEHEFDIDALAAFGGRGSHGGRHAQESEQGNCPNALAVSRSSHDDRLSKEPAPSLKTILSPIRCANGRRNDDWRKPVGNGKLSIGDAKAASESNARRDLRHG